VGEKGGRQKTFSKAQEKFGIKKEYTYGGKTQVSERREARSRGGN